MVIHMKKFNISVNGKKYEVEVEEITSGVSDSANLNTVKTAPVQAAPKAEAKPQPSPVKEVPAAVSAPAGAKTVKAPMPGTILKVNVQNGGLVKKGDVLVVLEAMKMENDIQAPADGTVSAVHVTAGTSVDTDAPLVSLS